MSDSHLQHDSDAVLKLQEKLGKPATAALLSKGWVVDYMTRVEETPRLKEYMASDLYCQRPLNNPSATFNN